MDEKPGDMVEGVFPPANMGGYSSKSAIAIEGSNESTTNRKIVFGEPPDCPYGR